MEEWTFRENKDWKQNYSNCNLLNQSPINIDSEFDLLVARALINEGICENHPKMKTDR